MICGGRASSPAMINIKAQEGGENVVSQGFEGVIDIVYSISPGQKKKPHAEHEAVRSTSL